MVELSDWIEAVLSQRPTAIRALSGGMIGEVYRVDLPNHERIVAKVAENKAGTLDIEGYMLRYLRDHSELTVPDVLHSEPNLLLMSYIEGDSRLSASVQRHAAELLADLHNVRAPQLGLERDTLIGPLHQPNPWTDSWIAFFRQHRLLYMARSATKESALPKALLARIEQFAERLEDYLLEPAHPSLIHGDMWTTNILAVNGRVSGFIDPACYYGHAEIELAFSGLFGTFSAPFYNHYHEIRPIAPGFFEVRKDIYNLYPLLVHVRLFGGSYVQMVEGVLRKFGF